jgi:M-phase inducer tyrosine phosphatase
MMDMSPLPHKVPFVAHVELPSPTPGSDDMMMDTTPIPRSGSLQPSKPMAAE